MTLGHRLYGGRVCDYQYFLLTGSSRRDRAARSTGKSRSTGTVPTQKTVNPLITHPNFSVHIDELQIYLISL